MGGASSERLVPEVSRVAAQAVAPLGLVVEHVTSRRAGSRSLVRVLLVRDLSGLASEDTTSTVAPLDLDEVAEATRAISDAVDRTGVAGESAYVLEVSSAGVDRPLLEPAQFRRNVGRLVRLRLHEGGEVVGRIQQAGRTQLSLQTPATKKVPARVVEHGYEQIERGQVEIEFSRPEPSADQSAAAGDATTRDIGRTGERPADAEGEDD